MNQTALFNANIPALPTLTQMLQTDPEPANITNILWLQEDRLLTLRRESKLAHIWNTTTGAIDWTFELPKMGFHQALSPPDRRWLLLTFPNHQAALIEPEWGQILWSKHLSRGVSPLQACLSPDGAVVYLLTTQLKEQSLSAWRLGEDRALWRRTWKKPDGGFFCMSLSGTTLFLCEDTGQLWENTMLTRCDTKTGSTISQAKMVFGELHESLVNITAIDEQHIVLYSHIDYTRGDRHPDYFSALALYDAVNAKHLWSASDHRYRSILHRAPHLYCLFEHPKQTGIDVLHIKDGGLIDRSTASTELLALALSPSQEQLAILSERNTISIYRWST